MPLSVGIGYDSHRFSEGRRLILGGVEIPGEKGLAGHSDADVLTHSVIDAVLGAAGLEDIGALFPDSEDAWKGQRCPSQQNACRGPAEDVRDFPSHWPL